MQRWKITTEGSSRTTILSRDGLPIARFYAGRFDEPLLRQIEQRLNKEG